MPTPVRGIAVVLVVALATASCFGEPDGDPAGTAHSGRTRLGPAGSESGVSSDEPLPSTSSQSSAPSDKPLRWGPTEAELARAHDVVRLMSAAELAGQVIVGRWLGTDPSTAARMVAEHHLAGVQLTGDNIVDRSQVRATTAAVVAAFERTGRTFPPVIGVDEEGGVVAALRGIAVGFPSFATAGTAVAQEGRSGRRTVQAAMRAKATELRGLGFTWVFAPVADVVTGDAGQLIGSRSASSDPEIAAAAVSAAVEGYVDAGMVSTTKHFPGLGEATQDSHQTLPQIDVTRQQLQARDLPPFEAAVRAGAPAVMVGHLEIPFLASGVPTSLAPDAYRLLRRGLEFEGVAITDALGMGAVITQEHPAINALAAGADLLLMPADTARTHGVVTRAIQSGDLSRERVEEAATRVVAVQLWQQRVSRARPVPRDVATRAAAAARDLLAAAS